MGFGIGLTILVYGYGVLGFAQGVGVFETVYFCNCVVCDGAT